MGKLRIRQAVTSARPVFLKSDLAVMIEILIYSNTLLSSKLLPMNYRLAI